MVATIVSRTPTSFTVQIEVPYSDSMLGLEEGLQERLNEAGVEATAEGLRQFDTDGSPITLGSVRLTSKGPVEMALVRTRPVSLRGREREIVGASPITPGLVATDSAPRAASARGSLAPC